MSQSKPAVLPDHDVLKAIFETSHLDDQTLTHVCVSVLAERRDHRRENASYHTQQAAEESRKAAELQTAMANISQHVAQEGLA